MEFIPNFIKRKHGQEEVIYPHPLLEPILSNSYGIMVYQEQIMQTAQIIAGYSLGQADLLRRAMGKKKLDEMQKQREIFVKGAGEKHNIPAKKAEEIFLIMEKFAQYGFNRSHSAAYSVVAYQTAYLKANYPAEYMASVLTHNQNNIEKITFFLDECKKQGISVLGPDINESDIMFDVNREEQIRFGLGAIKGTGEAAVEAIIKEREAGGFYTGIFDFSKRVSLRTVNKKTFEALALSGAFDSFTKFHRRQYVEAQEGEQSLIEKAIRYGNLVQAEKNSAQVSLFGDNSSVMVPEPKIPDLEPFGDIEKLRLEKEVVGFYISGHPLDQFKIEICHFCTCTVNQIENYKGQEISVAGIVTKSIARQTKTGKPFGLFTIEDYEGSLDMALFGEEWKKFGHFLSIGDFVFITGIVQERYNQIGMWELKPTSIQLLHDIRQKMCKTIQLQVNYLAIDPLLIEQLEYLSQKYPGNCNLQVTVYDEASKISIGSISRKFRIQPDNALIDEISKIEDVSYRLLSN